jgi:phage terminase large subunit
MTAVQDELQVNIKIPAAYAFLDEPARFKVAETGRSAAGSHSYCRGLLRRALQGKERILCAREIQKSIKDSVHKLLCDLIQGYGLTNYFSITLANIYSVNGSEFMFCGLWQNVTEVKSKEGITICYVEEAQRISEDSWDYLIPTIREEDSEIWIKYNPDAETDPTYKRFHTNKPDDAILKHLTYRDNPYFPEVSRREMEWCKRTDYEKYLWIWEGQCRKMSEAIIFRGKFVVEEFETPADAQFYHGLDFGFAIDPTVLVRFYISGKTLFIDQECWGVGVEINDLPALFMPMETARRWRIRADNSRPETISYLRNHGLDVVAAEKWPGSVEEGIEFIRSFEKIVIHPRCKHTIDDFKTYAFKTDKLTNEPLPIPLDKNNHSPDAIRYGLETFIRQRTFHLW